MSDQTTIDLRYARWPDSYALYHATRRARSRAMSEMFVATARGAMRRIVEAAVFVRARRDYRASRIDVAQQIAVSSMNRGR